MDCDSIQGNIVPGFNKDHQAFVFVRFSSREGARSWLGQVAPDLTSSTEAQRFKERFKQLRAEAPHPDGRDGGALDHISATWINLALSFSGVRLLLGPVEASRFPPAFRMNRVPGAEAPAAEVHALLIVATDQPEDLETELGRQRQRMSPSGVGEVMTLCGDTLPGDKRGHEHFGFKDAISQPRIAGTDWGSGPDVAAGEFVLGYPDQTGQSSGAGMPAWVRNGSFLAFVKLQQHVGAFWKSMKQQAELFGVQPGQMAEWIVGRHLDAQGTPLSKTPSRVSHIGRAYSRWLPPSESLRHRILRRGIPYGPHWTPDTPDDAPDRGLLFVAYQADLERQFEHVWSTWLNSPNFPTPATGRDPLAGQPAQVGKPELSEGFAPSSQVAVANRRPALISQGGNGAPQIHAALPTFVTPRFGAYFMAPPIDAVEVFLDS